MFIKFAFRVGVRSQIFLKYFYDSPSVTSRILYYRSFRYRKCTTLALVFPTFLARNYSPSNTLLSWAPCIECVFRALPALMLLNVHLQCALVYYGIHFHFHIFAYSFLLLFLYSRQTYNLLLLLCLCLLRQPQLTQMATIGFSLPSVVVRCCPFFIAIVRLRYATVVRLLWRLLFLFV